MLRIWHFHQNIKKILYLVKFYLRENTHRAKAAIRSALVMLRLALYLIKFPVAVSNATSAPTETVLDPTTPEKLTTGFAVNPMLALTPA